MDDLNGNVSARAETEKKLLMMWLDILKLKDIGIHDNFLDLGGDSLSAMLCISRVRTEFGVELQIEDFFVDPASIAELAMIIHQGQAPQSTK